VRTHRRDASVWRRRPAPARAPAPAAWVAGALALLAGCATDLGTGAKVVEALGSNYPITVGRLVEARMDTSSRLRVYISICDDAGPEGPVCAEEGLRVLAMVESRRTRVLKRLANRYLRDGSEKPLYVYGPLCDGMEEMILVPRCQKAVAIGVWDPLLRDYVIYSTLHGSGSFVESEGFDTFLEVTGRAAGIARKAAK
jgi:hypothetical protein